MYVRLETRALWERQSLPEKLRNVVRLRWTPSEQLVQQAAREAFVAEVFGSTEDFGDHLFRLNSWHHSREWNLERLTPSDDERAYSLEAFSVLTRLRLREAYGHPALNLRLAETVQDICALVYPMVVKIPITSLRFFLDAHATFAFNSVRRASHPRADDIIAYLYEILFLQQKTAIGLNEFIRLAAYANENKRTSGLISAEVNAIMEADLLFTYLKASVEKTLSLVGAVYQINGLDDKKTHKGRMSALSKGLPAGAADTPYGRLLLELAASENLDDLNSYRSGLLHKKGIADLQPHNYVSVGVSDTPFVRIFGVLREQHARNTAALLAALAMLTDDLVARDPPETALADIPFWASPT